MRLQLKTLTPVHISTGRDLEALDYVQVGSCIHRLHLDKALDIIAGEAPDAAEKFADWVDEKIFRTQNAGNRGTEDRNQAQSRIKQDTNLRNFCKKFPNGDEILRKVIAGATLYKTLAPVGMDDKTRINEQIKGPDSLPLIPGTSIKGAVKTALAAIAWMKIPEAERKRLLNFSKKPGRDRFTVKYKDDAVLNYLFSCGDRNDKWFDPGRFNIFKFFSFSDAQLQPGFEGSVLEVLPVYLYLRDKEPQPQTNPQEVVVSGLVFDFEISVDVNALSRALAESRKHNGYWRGLEEKVERLFNLRIGSLKKEELEGNLLEALMSVLKEQSRVAFGNDEEWMRGVKRNSQKNGLIQSDIQRLEELFKKGLPPGGGAFKLGWGSGFLSTTIFSSLRLTNKDFVEEMFLNARIGIPRSRGKEYTAPNLDTFPKSKRLTAAKKMYPDSFLGWVQIGQNLEPEPVEREIKTTEAAAAKPEVKPAAERIPELTAANEKLKLKDVVTMTAVVEGSESPFIICRILHSQLNSELYKAKYVNGLPAGSLVSLKVTFQKPGKIQNVSFVKTL